MTGATQPPDPLAEGYPRSTAADLDPGLDLSQSLEEADRAASNEHRVMPEDYQPAGPPDRGDGFENIDDMAYR
jgi:hypothetical protein